MQDATAKAQQIAEGLGIALDKPILVTEGSSRYPVEPAAEWGIGGGGATVAVPGITPGTFSVSVSVRVVYAIRE